MCSTNQGDLQEIMIALKKLQLSPLSQQELKKGLITLLSKRYVPARHLLKIDSQSLMTYTEREENLKRWRKK